MIIWMIHGVRSDERWANVLFKIGQLDTFAFLDIIVAGAIEY